MAKLNIYPEEKNNQLIAGMVEIYEGKKVTRYCQEPYDNPTLEDIEMRAQNSSQENQWRIVLLMAFYGSTYKRIGKENWIVVDENEGYA